MRIGFFIGILLFFQVASAEPSRQISGQNIPSPTLSQKAMTGSTYSLHLFGQASENKDVMEMITEKYVRPLLVASHLVSFSFVQVVSGYNMVRFNLILEPISPEGLPFLEEYISQRQNTDFLGLPVVFKKVSVLFQTSVLKGGTYDPSTPEYMVPKSEERRSLTFANLAQWKEYSVHMGQAFTGTDANAFASFIKEFSKSSNGFDDVVRKVLKTSNYLRLQALTHLVLEDGQVTEPGWDETPFVPWYYNRNCTLPKYGGGVCTF